jgi:hypothetical protein
MTTTNRDFISQRYSIAEPNIEGLKALVDKLAKRAKRLKVEPIQMIISPAPERVETLWWDMTDPHAAPLKEYPAHDPYNFREEVRRWFTVTIIGHAPRLAGWTFAATLATVEGSTLVMAVPGISIPVEYWTAPIQCEHCRSARQRKDTYLLMRDSGTTLEWKQVGSNCLKDFLGHRDPHAAASMAELWTSLSSYVGACGEERDLWGRSAEPKSSLLSFLAQTCAVVRDAGWLSRSTARERAGMGWENSDLPTADIVWSMLHDPEFSRQPRNRGKYLVSEVEVTKAREMLAWAEDNILALPIETLSDYMRNLAVVLRSEAVTNRTGGIAASLWAAHRRAVEVQQERELAKTNPSQWQGEVGKRGDWVLKVRSSRVMAGEFTSTLIQLVDASGNRFSWFASGAREMVEGEWLNVRGTVKGHVEVHGHRVTNLTRCTISKSEVVGS